MFAAHPAPRSAAALAGGAERPEFSEKSRAQQQEIARPGKYIQGARQVSSANRSALASGVDDKVTPEECRQKFLDDDLKGAVWFKNHFSACHARILLFDHYQCKGKDCVLTGRAMADAVFFTTMNKNERAADLAVKLWDFKEQNYPNERRINFAVGCWGAQSGVRCDPTTSEVTGTFGEWKNYGTVYRPVKYIGTGTETPNDPALNEKRTYFELNPYFYVESGNKDGSPAFVTFPPVYLRCDIARTAVNPQYARGSDCIFHELAGSFQVSASDPAIAESAQFIRRAQEHIEQTKPGTPGTYVPGRYGSGQALTRMYYDQAAIDTNRSTSIAKCVEFFGPDYTKRNDPKNPSDTNDCDEYPFAKTHQGTYSVKGNTPRSYAVQPLLSQHNQKLGSMLGIWMGEDHILEEDPFYVIITD
ncbi:hypothetical protein D5S17_14705 [Pseudonocardiaceae bacterium YIM PH 21723]|nr:hypothetical protein D5S17_14705 [Pseudonocardiaceae bacterium YIM PH 21723]